MSLGYKLATFSDKQLEYIYNYLDCDANKEIYREIEIKIRKQIKIYSDFDKKREKSLIGWVRKGWELRMCVGNAHVPLVFPSKEVYHDMKWVDSVKVRITIEEL